MDPEGRNFGKGPNELTGAGDLLSHFKLLPHYEYFCKRPLPLSISNTSYLLRMVGDTEIRKGEGMQLDQLIQNASTRDTNINIRPFGLDVLRDAFQFKEGGPVDLPQAEKGVPTFPSKSNSEIKDKEKKHRKHKDRDSEKDRVHKKHKHRHKDRSKDMHKEKRDRSARPDSGVDQSKKHEKKRKHDGDENISDVHRHKKSKHKSSKLDDMGAIRVAG